ncbi:MAG: glycosyltransferase family 4 protein [Bacteroidales bacterium]|nr:glycosyltransferase family 4 protein [Bacteroidales bacterium]
MENKKIIIISLFFYEVSDNIRISTVYNLLKERNAEVELITTDFNHRTKKKHDTGLHPKDITFLKVPGYKKNLSIGRLFSHFVFALRLSSYLRNLTSKPSKIYCIVPTVSSGWVCSRYCRKKNIPFAADVIDLWPESLIVLSRKKKLLQFLTFPMKWMAQKVYKAADLLYAGSADYAKYAGGFNKKTIAMPVYLGTDVSRFRSLVSSAKAEIHKPEGQKWICFGGMLGNSYDIDIILSGFEKLVRKESPDVKLIFIGDGQERNRIMSFKEQKGLDIEITGFLPYADYLKYLNHADIAINSFKEGTRVAYSYKFNDYVTAGIPIVNNVKGEMAELVEQYNLGRNFRHNADSLADKLYEMLSSPDLLSEMKKNATFVATSVLDKKVVYKEMLDHLMK